MKRFATLFCLPVVISAHLLAGSPDKSIGTKTSTVVADGKIVQKTETLPESNLLPPGQSFSETVRMIPNSGRINSSIRWTSTDAAAIGQDVATNQNGTNVFIGWNLNSMRVSFHDNSSATPLWEHVSDPSTWRNYVALSASVNIVANASYHNIYLFDKSTGAITFDFPVPESRIAGPIAVSRDGQLLVCATQSPLAGGIHRVYAFNPPSTTPVWTFDFSDGQSNGVYGVNISVDKSTVAVNGRMHGYILNASDGVLRTQFDISNTESRVALSADASVMAFAELSGFVKAFAYNPADTAYALIWQYRVPPGVFTNWATVVDVSADGSTLMAGTLIFGNGGTYDGTVYLFDTFGEGTPNWILTGLGDYVSGVALSDDGSLGAATTWGDFNNPSKPTVYIFERGSNQAVYTVSSPGSMFSLSMSADGRTVVAGGKHVHARTFGSGGDVYDVAVDLGGGAIAGTVILGGVPPNHSGTLVEVLGTTRFARTLPAGEYVVPNVPPGTYSVRMSHLGYVSATLTNVTVTGTDTTQNVDASLAQTGDPPSNLLASHSLDSRIQLNWTNPTLAGGRMVDKELAAGRAANSGLSVSALHPRSTSPNSIHPLDMTLDPVPPDSIKIYRGIRTGGPYYLKRILAGSVSSYVDSTAIPLQNYYYRVTATYGGGESIFSNEAYGTVDSSFLQFSFETPQLTATPTIDGTLSPFEWSDAIQVDVSDVFGNGGGVRLPRGSALMWFKYDSVARKLYIAGEDFLNTDGLANNEGFGLYFDDNHNRRYEPIGTDPLLREGNYWALFSPSGSVVRFREIYTGGGVSGVVDTVHDAEVAFSTTTGHVTGEVSIPLGFFDRNHLQVFGPDRTVGAGIYLRGVSGSGASLYHGWWPQAMVNLFDPMTFGDIRIPIMLLAPPKAPSDIQVTRQDSLLHVTWVDPTEGINNEPLTVPVNLQLWRNGVLWREFPAGIESWTDSSVVAQGWYEYKMRGSIDVMSAGSPNSTTYFGPFSQPVGAFTVSDPLLTEMLYDDGIPEVFYVVDFAYNGNQFGIRFTPQQYPARVYRVQAFTNNGNKPIDVAIHSDSLGLPGAKLAGDYPGVTYQTAGVDSFLVTIPAADPPTIESGSFWVLLKYLPTSPEAPGIGGDYTAPIDGRTFYYTYATGWQQMTNVDLLVRAFVTGQTSSVEDAASAPREFALLQNYPNPFNPATVIRYTLPVMSPVTLKVYNVLGQEIATLANDVKQAGRYEVVWDASAVSSGVYFYKLTTPTFTAVKKLLLLR